VGTEHLLLGMVREKDGVAAQVLASFGLTIENLRREMHRILGHAPGSPSRSEFVEAPAAPSSGGLARLPERIGAVLGEAYKVAGRAGATHLEALHVAIGLLAHGEGTAITAVERMGCDVPRLAAELEAMLPASTSIPTPQVVPFSPDFLNVLGAAIDEQQQSGDPTVSTHHLLLALLEKYPDVAQVFNRHGVSAAGLRTEASRIVG
jgi:ATP-dependent Clp protease ATP-binding subunit ClpA